MDRKKNCFNLIRLLAAIEVFIGHASEHFEIPLPPMLYEIWYAFRGVPIFFILSGFLIWNSLLKEENFKIYCRKRVARLYPELWAGVLINAAVMLAVYGKEIMIVPFIAFTFAQATVFQFWTPDCLRGYGVGTPNGALWTIGVMVQSYCMIFALNKWLRGRKSRMKFLIALLFAGMALNIITPGMKGFFPDIAYKLWSQTFFPYIWLFILGAVICECFDGIINFLMKYWPVLLAASLLISVLHLENGIGIYETVGNSLLGAAIVGFAYALPDFDIKYDFSYGFYIYHMIVINFMVEYGCIGKVSYFLIAFIASATLAVISYYVAGELGRKLKRKTM